MSTWMSEEEFRLSGANSVGVTLNKPTTLNVPFLHEIKQDFNFRETLDAVYDRISALPMISAREASRELSELRDQLEAYFALEEFYGYFQQSAETNPLVNNKAEILQTDHEKLFVQLNNIVELSEQIVYRECRPSITVQTLASELQSFRRELANHEQAEMSLMMRLHNEDIGVGD